MTVNQVTEQLLTPREIREIVTFIKRHRTTPEPFDIAVNGETPSDLRSAAQIVQPYAEAGTTWWIEYEGSRGSLQDYRKRIRRGPPKG